MVIGNQKQKNEVRKLILQNQKILLFGDVSVGKSSLVKEISTEIGYRLVLSYPRNDEDLLKDFAQLPFETKKTLFVIEGDSFYWRSYGLVNHYLQSNNPIVIIVNLKDTVHKTVADQVVPIKLYPPTKQDVEEFVRKRYPNWNGRIEDVYSNDLRITLRNIKYGITSYVPQQLEPLNSQQVSYSLLQGTAKREDIENCSDPQIFVLNWLGNNVHKFYSNKKKLDDVSFVDSYKFDYKKKYLDGMLLTLGKANLRGKMKFPPIKFKLPKEVEEEWEKERRKKSKISIKKSKQETILKFGTDMSL